MKKTDVQWLLMTSVAIVCILSGCSKDHLDPTQIGRFRPVPAVNVILDTLGVAEEAKTTYEGAEDPRPADVVAYEQDYAFSSGDVIRISVFELLQEGQSYVDNFIVSESGNISIPEVGQIQAAGLTETQLEEEIRNALSPGILKNPSVTVTLVSSQSRVFTILGDGIARPNRYEIPRYDFRLMDAIATAGSASQFNVSYIYVARRLTGQEQTGDVSLRPVEAGKDLNQPGSMDKGYSLSGDANDSQMLEIIEPAILNDHLVITSAEMATEKELEELAKPDEMPKQESGDEQAVSNVIPQTQQTGGRIEWVFQDGKWVPVRMKNEDAETVSQQPVKEQLPVLPKRSEREISQKPVAQKQPELNKQSLPENYGWEDMSVAGVQNRVIRIPN